MAAVARRSAINNFLTQQNAPTATAIALLLLLTFQTSQGYLLDQQQKKSYASRYDGQMTLFLSAGTRSHNRHSQALHINIPSSSFSAASLLPKTSNHHRALFLDAAASSTSSSSSSSSSGQYSQPYYNYNNYGGCYGDEYEAIVLFPKHEVPFFLQETDDGEVAFAGYVQWDEPVSTIRNIGDVIIEIDGASTAGSSIKEVIQFIQEKSRKHSHAFFKFRASKNNNNRKNEGDDVQNGVGRLPGAQQRLQLEAEVAQIDRDVALKRAHIDDLNQKRRAIKQELAELHRLDLEWIEQKRGALKELEEAEKGNQPAWAISISNINSNASAIASKTSSLFETNDSTLLRDLDFRTCIAEVQQAMKLMGSGGSSAAGSLNYDTLDHVKAVLTKLDADIKKEKSTNNSKSLNNEIKFLDSAVGIKEENYHVYVKEIYKIINLVKSNNTSNKNPSQLRSFCNTLQRSFGPVPQQVNGE